MFISLGPSIFLRIRIVGLQKLLTFGASSHLVAVLVSIDFNSKKDLSKIIIYKCSDFVALN